MRYFLLHYGAWIIFELLLSSFGILGFLSFAIFVYGPLHSHGRGEQGFDFPPFLFGNVYERVVYYVFVCNGCLPRHIGHGNM